MLDFLRCSEMPQHDSFLSLFIYYWAIFKRIWATFCSYHPVTLLLVKLNGTPAKLLSSFFKESEISGDKRRKKTASSRSSTRSSTRPTRSRTSTNFGTTSSLRSSSSSWRSGRRRCWRRTTSGCSQSWSG